MTDFYQRYTYTVFLLKLLAFTDLLFIIYVLWRSGETGDNLLLWLPLLIFLPIIGMPAYIIYRLKVRSDDCRWDREQLSAEKYRGGYVSRRVKSEQELRDQYYRGKGRRG